MTLALLAILSTAWGACVDYAQEPARLSELEAFATKGALQDDHKACLETSYKAAELQTTKDKISRVLLVNAYANNTATWSELVQRHLDEVDRSDPDIAYLYAFYLYNNEKADADQVIEWTELALERRDVWTGDVYVSRVYGLMRLRAIAGLKVWEAAEADRLKGVESDQGKLDDLRDRAKTYAREWVDFAKVSGRSVTKPMELCMSVANNARACGAE